MWFLQQGHYFRNFSVIKISISDDVVQRRSVKRHATTNQKRQPRSQGPLSSSPEKLSRGRKREDPGNEVVKSALNYVISMDFSVRTVS